MTQIRSSRRRRAVVLACLPYLLLSLFVDFVHLHPLLSGSRTQISVSQHIGKCSETRPKTPEAVCAICQWLRTGTALKTSAAAGPTIVLLPESVALNVLAARGSPALFVIDPRGPPSPRVA